MTYIIYYLSRQIYRTNDSEGKRKIFSGSENHHGRDALKRHTTTCHEREMVFAGLPTHSGSRSRVRQPFWIPRLFLQRTRWSESRAPPEGQEPSSADTVAFSSYFSRVKRPRPWAILLILDVAAVYPLRISRIFCLAGGRLCVDFYFAYLVYIGSFSLNFNYLFIYIHVVSTKINGCFIANINIIFDDKILIFFGRKAISFGTCILNNSLIL